MKSTKFAFCILLAVLTCLSSAIWAQEESGEDQAAEGVDEEALVAPETKVEPVFPEVNEALIFVEGEDAVNIWRDLQVLHKLDPVTWSELHPGEWDTYEEWNKLEKIRHISK